MSNQPAQVDSHLAVDAKIACGACDTQCASAAKFCGGCGQSLYEPCGGCGQQVSLTQKFCGSCGADLASMLKERQQQNRTYLADALKSAKNADFDRALTLLRRVAGSKDYRFAAESNQAEQAIEKVTRLRDQSESSIRTAIEKAKILFDGGDQQETLKILESVPEHLLTGEARKILTTVQAHTQRRKNLETQLRESIAVKDWPTVAGLLEQLLSIESSNQRYLELANKVTGKLVLHAKECIAKRKYSQAVSRLNAVPLICQSDDYAKLHDLAENVDWLSSQFESEPFVTPVLGRLAVRFAKEVPDDREAKELVKKLAHHLKKGPRQPRCHAPAWKGTANSWIGGKMAYLGIPQSVDLAEDKLLRKYPGRFNVAIGLALQGLGQARITEHFGPRQRLLGALSRRGKSAWGVDIGSAGVKAVCLQNSEDGLVVTDSFFEEFEAPLCRAGNPRNPQEVIQSVVERFLESHDTDDKSVWVNVPASKLVSRFVRLPPTKDKVAKSLLQKEVESNIPIALDELRVVTWMAELTGDESRGRPAYIAAARKRVVDELLATLESAGLKVSGVQGDTVALINFAAHEFSDLWESEKGGSETVPSGTEGDQVGSPTATCSPTVAIVDCGASAVSLILVSSDAQWSWTTETGGEDLTSQLARVTTTTHAEAEKLKRDPSALAKPAHYVAVENRQDLVRPRLESAFGESRKQNDRFDIVGCWCVGGGCKAHQWMRRVIQDK